MKESNVLARVRLVAQQLGLILFRNNVGLTYTGETIRLSDGSILIKNPRPIRFGLTLGSSDLIGWTEHTIREMDVGRRVAIFTSIEAKTERGQPTEDQQNFLARVRASGGIAAIVRSESDCQAAIDTWKRGSP